MAKSGGEPKTSPIAPKQMSKDGLTARKPLSSFVDPIRHSSTFNVLASSTATDVDERSVSPVCVGIDEPQSQHLITRRQDLAILRIARRCLEAEISLPSSTTFELQLIELCIVGDMHHYTVAWPLCHDVRKAALCSRLSFGALTVFFVMERGNAPLSNQALPRESSSHRRTY